MSADFTVQDWVRVGKEVLEIEAQGLNAVCERLDENFANALGILANCQGRVVVSGVGKSGLVGRKIAATLSSTGTPAYFLHPVEGAHGDLGLIREGDVVLAISKSGETDELNAILPTLISLGAKTVGLTADLHSTMARLCNVCVSIEVPQEACPLGLAPTASTTATLAVGDALAVALIRWKSFDSCDFKRFHPGGVLGRQLSQKIASLMHEENIPVVDPLQSLEEALQVLNEGGLGTVLIANRAKCLKGILTDGDVRRLVCRGGMILQDAVQNYMTVNPRYVLKEQKAAEVLDIMEASAITVLPVLNEQNELQGLVHLHDLLGKGRFKFSGNQYT
mgnify:CR=1 FL=1